jgi:hypothetical protein
MKQPFLTLMLVALAFVTGYELQKVGQPLQYSETATYQSRASSPAVGAAPQAGTLPLSVSSREEKIRQQEKKVEVLAARAKEQKAAISELDQKLAQQDQQSQTALPQMDSLSDQIEQSRMAIARLQEQKQARAQQRIQQSVYQDVRNEEHKLNEQLASTQFQEQLGREQAQLGALEKQVQELSQVNANLDSLTTLQPQLLAQRERVQQLKAQYRDYQLGLAAQKGLEQLNGSQAPSSRLNASSAGNEDEQIQRQQQALTKLEQQAQEIQAKQQAGQAADETLSTHYQTIKNEYDETVRRYDLENRALIQLKANAK